MSILHLPILPDNSCGFRGTRTLSRRVDAVKGLAKGPAPLKKEAITIETGPTAANEILGGTVPENGVQPMSAVTEILGGTSLLGGTKTRPNGIGIIVLGGTRRNQPRQGVIENGTVQRLRAIIKRPA